MGIREVCALTAKYIAIIIQKLHQKPYSNDFCKQFIQKIDIHTVCRLFSCTTPLLLQILVQLLGVLVLAQLGQGLGLNLTDALARHGKLLPNFL